MSKTLYLIGGVLMVILGVIGAVLPIMPTVPFLIAAAFCFSRSDPKWEAYLLEHPQIGPGILAWRERGAIPLGGKLAATGAMAVSATGSAYFLEGWIAWAPATVFVIVAVWMYSRPNA